MQCPTCSQFNAATDVRCLNCRTTLIYEAEGHSKQFKKAAHTLDARMYSGIGALLGFFCYMTYDLTNQATLATWSTKITVLDIIWGTFLTGSASLAGFWVTQALLGKNA